LKKTKKMASSEEEVRAGHLLIVDDDPITVEAFQQFFQKNGYESVGCTSGRDALEILKSQCFDVLLTDLDLREPKTNGIELLKTGKKTNPALIGIIMTGHCTAGTTAEAKKAGADALILKPLNLPCLLGIVCQLMTRNSRS
jgi:DNA-binding NtrC family response regulator